MAIFTVLFTLLLWLPSQSKAYDDPKFIIYGDSQHPPFSYYDTQQRARGIYTDIIRRTIQNMPLSLQRQTAIRLAPWKRVLNYAENGRAFAIFPPHYFPNLRPYLDHYSPALMAEYPSLFCNHTIPTQQRTRWPDDFTDLRIGISSGVKMGGEQFWAMVRNKKIRIERSPNVEINLRKLSTNRIDCHINDKKTIEWYAKRLNLTATLHHTLYTSPPSAGHLAYSAFSQITPDEKSAFIAAFAEAFDKLKANGDIDQIIQSY